MNNRLCIISGCIAPGKHDKTCAADDCKGCQPRAVERPQVCDSCRSRLAICMLDIAQLHAELGERDGTPAREWTVLQDPKGLTEEGPRREPGYDPVATHLPAGPSKVGTTPRISGSRETPVPANLEKIDLAARARHGSRGVFARGVLGLDTDQIGHLAVATILDTWVRDWRDEMAFTQTLPAPTVPELARWLSNRLEWACDRHPAIDDFAGEMDDLRHTLRRCLGQLNPRPEAMAAPCPGCDLFTLVRAPGHDDIECANQDCRRILRPAEYDQWSRLVLASRRRLAAEDNVVNADLPVDD